MNIKHIFFIYFLLFIISCDDKPAGTSHRNGETMPDFSLIQMDSTKIKLRSINDKRKTIIFYFTPTCPYCNKMAKDISENATSLNEIDILLVSNYPINGLKIFERQYNFNKYLNIKVLQDSSNSIFNYFQIKGVPYIAAYDINKRLKKSEIGIFDVDDLTKL